MIVSHRHRFVFVKTRKTAGTSVEIALSSVCGPDDVITPISPEDEAIRREHGYPGPQHCDVAFRRYSARDALHSLRRRRRLRFWNHLSASTARRWLGDDVWGGYRTFTIERDPWDRALSLYYWRTRDLADPPPIETFLRTVGRRSVSNHHLYADEHGLLVDQVLRYEHLADELTALGEELGLGPLPELPRAKGSHRSDRRDPARALSPEAIAIVAELCAPEIELVGFEPPVAVTD